MKTVEINWPCFTLLLCAVILGLCLEGAGDWVSDAHGSALVLTPAGEEWVEDVTLSRLRDGDLLLYTESVAGVQGKKLFSSGHWLEVDFRETSVAPGN